MGWNSGYACMEASVIAAYNSGGLTKEGLEIIMEPYRDSDIDHGGCKDLRSNDGLSADEIICKIMEPEKYALISEIPAVKPARVEENDGKFYLNGYRYDSWQEAVQDKRNSSVYTLWSNIVRKSWNIQ